ncbi:MAG: hypothetical protein P8127_03540 [Acidobacteriota bacterium]
MIDGNRVRQLLGQIDYRFVGHLEQLDDAGRLLVWEAKIEGDLAGRMKWWFVDPGPAPEVSFTGGQTAFYAARWEIWNREELLLAGESTGKTVFREGEDGIWDGHGVVTEANGPHSDLVGRKIYESGPVIIGPDPPVSFSGTGIFSIH